MNAPGDEFHSIISFMIFLDFVVDAGNKLNCVL